MDRKEPRLLAEERCGEACATASEGERLPGEGGISQVGGRKLGSARKRFVEQRNGGGVGAAGEAVVRQMCELWATRDANAMADLFTEDGIYHNVPNPPMEGREVVRAYLRKVCERLGVEADVLHLACDGEWVLSERLDTHIEGERSMSLPVMNISRVMDGKLALWRDYYDTQMVKDLGLA